MRAPQALLTQCFEIITWIFIKFSALMDCGQK